MIRNRSLYLVLAAVIVLGMSSGLAHGQLTIDDVLFEQADWYLPDGAVFMEDSLWGSMTYSYVPVDTQYYLNVTASTSPTGQEAWVIQNAPIPVAAGGDYSQRLEGIDINLEDLGLFEGDDWSQVYVGVSEFTRKLGFKPAAFVTSGLEILAEKNSVILATNACPARPPESKAAMLSGAKRSSIGIKALCLRALLPSVP